MIKSSLKIKFNNIFDFKRFFIYSNFILAFLACEVYAQQKLTPELDSISNYSQSTKSNNNSNSNQNNYSKSDYAQGDYNSNNDSNNYSGDNTANDSSSGSQPIKPTISQQDQAKINNLMKRGMQLTKQNNIKAAQNAFHKIILIDPTNSNAYYNLGVLAERTNNLSDAAHYYSLVLKYSPNDTETQQALDDVKQRLNASANDYSSNTSKANSNSSDYSNYSSNNSSSKNSARNFSYDNTSDANYPNNSYSQSSSNSQGFQPSQPLNKNSTRNINFNRNLNYVGRSLGRLARSAMWYAMMFR